MSRLRYTLHFGLEIHVTFWAWDTRYILGLRYTLHFGLEIHVIFWAWDTRYILGLRYTLHFGLEIHVTGTFWAWDTRYILGLRYTLHFGLEIHVTFWAWDTRYILGLRYTFHFGLEIHVSFWTWDTRFILGWLVATLRWPHVWVRTQRPAVTARLATPLATPSLLNLTTFVSVSRRRGTVHLTCTYISIPYMLCCYWDGVKHLLFFSNFLQNLFSVHTASEASFYVQFLTLLHPL